MALVVNSPATYIGPAADKAATLGGAAYGDYYFEDDTGITYRKATSDDWIQTISPEEQAVFLPENYGEVGEGVDSALAINAAIAAAHAAGGGTVPVRYPLVEIETSLDWNGADHVKLEGLAFFGTEIRQMTSNIPVLKFDTDGASYNEIENIHFSYDTQQTTAETDAFGIAVTIAGSSVIGVFGLHLHNIKVSKAYAGFGVNKASGSVTLWNVTQTGSFYIIDCAQYGIFWDNPTAVGMPECTFQSIYIQNPAIAMAGKPVIFEAVEVHIGSLGIENITDEPEFIKDELIEVRSATEAVIIDLLHCENISFLTNNTRAIRLTSTGYLKIGFWNLKNCIINVTSGGTDAYLIVPAGGRVDVGSIAYVFTNTSGNLALVASGTGLVSIGHIVGTGTLLTTHSWDTAALQLIEPRVMSSVALHADNINRAKREQFLHDLLAITGDTRVLWLPKIVETTTSIDESLTGRTITYDATIAARLSALGNGYAVSFNGTSQYGTTPDTANLSFGDGTNDSAVSFIALCNVTNTAAIRNIISKLTDATTGEWRFCISAADLLSVTFLDDSADTGASRNSDAAITMGSWALFGFSYTDASGGATAANDMTLYQNGVVIPSTAVNNAGYVAMENTAAVVEIGSQNVHAANFFSGSMALVLVCQKALTASEHWAIKKLVNAYFGLGL